MKTSPPCSSVTPRSTTTGPTSAAVDKIDIPVYVTMSWGGKLRCMGFFDAWHRLTTKDRWLRTACDLEWPGFHDNKYQEDLLRFFDHFLLGKQNEWRATPPVRMTVADFAGHDLIDRPELEFPLTRAVPMDFYLNANALRMEEDRPDAAVVTHDAKNGKTAFDFTFGEPVELNGYPELRLFIEADGSDDADLFITLNKLSPEGDVQGRILIERRTRARSAVG